MKGLDRSRRSQLSLLAMVTAIALGVVTLVPRANATTYTYDVGTLDWPVSGGFITTNCDNCTLTSANILAWAFQSTDGDVNIASTAADAQLTLVGSVMQATPTAITFGFQPGPNFGDAIFAANNQSIDYFSEATAASTPVLFPDGIGETDACNVGNLLNGSCTGRLNQGTQTIAARTSMAPEIDAASWVSPVTLLAGAILVIRGRRRQVAVRFG
jgi:hypothetical protein